MGTTLEYTEKNGGYHPVYDSFCSPKFSFIEEFQQGAKQFIQDLSAQSQLFRPVDASEAALAYERLAFQPTLKTVKAFSALEYEDGKTFALAKTRSRLLYLVRPRLLFRDYRNAKWKEGFIKQLLPWITDPHAIACLVKSRNRIPGMLKGN